MLAKIGYKGDNCNISTDLNIFNRELENLP